MYITQRKEPSGEPPTEAAYKNKNTELQALYASKES